MKLNNKIAFVTGGTSGIGLETAKLFQAEGAHVVLVGSNAERLAAAGKELGGKALLVRADMRKVADIERAVEETRAKHGRIDAVFANAGATTVAPFDAVTEEYVAENLALNFTGTFFTIQKTAPLNSQGRQHHRHHVVPEHDRLSGPVDPRCDEGGDALTGPHFGRRVGAPWHPRECRQSRCDLNAVLQQDRSA